MELPQNIRHVPRPFTKKGRVQRDSEMQKHKLVEEVDLAIYYGRKTTVW